MRFRIDYTDPETGKRETTVREFGTPEEAHDIAYSLSNKEMTYKIRILPEEPTLSRYEQVEARAIARYRADKRNYGSHEKTWCVRIDAIPDEIFIGTKTQCELATMLLREAFLDGAWLAIYGGDRT